jgi:hypothetical protein
MKKIYQIAIAVISIALAIVIISPFVLSPFEEPHNQFFENDYKTPGREKVILISWAGCPLGASLSWPLYFSLEQHGNVSYYTGHSDPSDSYPCTPGLIFTNYTSSNINATFVYLYNDNLSGSFNNTTITGNLVTYGLNELKADLPQPYYHMAKKYTTQEWIAGGYFSTSADSVKPHHINTIIIISGSKGTYVLNGDLYSPSIISEDTHSELLSNGMNISAIHKATTTINKYIELAE